MFGAELGVRLVGWLELFVSSTRNLLETSSVAQNLDGGRLKGSLLFPNSYATAIDAPPQGQTQWRPRLLRVIRDRTGWFRLPDHDRFAPKADMTPT